MIIRLEAPADRAAIRLVVEAAFPSQAEAVLVDRLREDGDAVISLVACDAAGVVVGHVLFSRLVAGIRALGLAPVSVLPARQRAGIGSLMIRHGLAAAAAGGWEAVLVLGNPLYYRRFGFDPDLAAAIASPYSGPYLMALTLPPHAPRLAGRIDYPPAFAALA
jgi:putative acetyltransferase